MMKTAQFLSWMRETFKDNEYDQILEMYVESKMFDHAKKLLCLVAFNEIKDKPEKSGELTKIHCEIDSWISLLSEGSEINDSS